MKKVLLVDDHNIIRSGLKIMFSEHPDTYSFDEAADGDTAMNFISNNDYDIIMLDINMPGIGTKDIVQETLAIKPDAKILIFSMNAESIFAKPFLRMGAKGYVRKDEDAEEIQKAILAVLNNRRYISKELGENLAGEMLVKKSNNPFDKLSPKQSEITKLLIEGKGLSEICTNMNLHSSTVSTQKTRIFQKLDVSNIVDLYALAKMHLTLSH